MTFPVMAEVSQPRENFLMVVARSLWIGFAFLILGLYIAGIPNRYDHLIASADTRSLAQLRISVSSYATYVLLLDLLLILAHEIIAAVIFWRRSDDRMALFVAFALVTNGAVFPLSRTYASGSFPHLLILLVSLVIYLGLASSVLLLYLFPNGKFVPTWTGLFGFGWIVLNLPAVFVPSSKASLLTWPAWVQLLIPLTWAGVGLFAQIYRYWNVSNPLQRQQAKWALFGLIAAALGPLVFFLSFVILPSISGPNVPNVLYHRVGSGFFTLSFILQTANLTLMTLVALVFPVSFAIAILRYRLWEIDIIFNRALVYGALTTLLAIVYFMCVVLLQGFFSLLTSQDQNEVVTVLSTLAIAMLFVPLQRRVQALIDRRFYRRKYNMAKTLGEFSASLRNEVDLKALTEKIMNVVEGTMQPENISLWLKEPSDGSQEETLHMMEMEEKIWRRKPEEMPE